MISSMICIYKTDEWTDGRMHPRRMEIWWFDCLRSCDWLVGWLLLMNANANVHRWSERHPVWWHVNHFALRCGALRWWTGSIGKTGWWNGWHGMGRWMGGWNGWVDSMVWFGGHFIIIIIIVVIINGGYTQHIFVLHVLHRQRPATYIAFSA